MAPAATDSEEQYYWRVRTKLPERFGQACRILASDASGNVLIEFDDGFKVVTSTKTIRPIKKPCEDLTETQERMVRRNLKEKLTPLPKPWGDSEAIRASGDAICDICGWEYRLHPEDTENRSYDNQPFLNVLCDGARVKL